MSLSSMKTAITVKAARTALKVQKNSPTILFAGGVVGVVGAAVLASRATLKLHDELDKINEEKDQILNYKSETYGEKEQNHDLLVIRAQGVRAIAKLYAPAIIVGGVSIAALTRSHVVLTQRNAAAIAAYSALDKVFQKYRLNVIDEFGEEKDREFRYGTTTVHETVVDEDGKSKQLEKIVLDGSETSGYAKFFDELNPNYDRTPEHNYMFLAQQQNFANQRLLARGHLFLNEVYQALGMPHTKAGAVVGWMKDCENGDGFVDFGFMTGSERSRAFVNGPEKSILLDFNVDGIIYDLMDE